MWRSALVLIAAAAGCRTLGEWRFQPGVAQSISGSRPFVTVHALDAATSDLAIECAADGLLLTFRGPPTGDGITVRFDDGPPVTLPTSLSLRGVPSVDLRAPIGADTAEQRLIGAERLAVEAEPTVLFDVSHADRAIRRLRCP